MDIKVLNHILLTLASDHDKQKIKNLYTKFFIKNKPDELTYHKAGLLMQYPRKYQAKKVMKFRVLKEESANSMMSGIQSFHGSFMIPVTMLIMQCDVCRKAGPDIAGKTEFVTVKKV